MMIQRIIVTIGCNYDNEDSYGEENDGNAVYDKDDNADDYGDEDDDADEDDDND